MSVVNLGILVRQVSLPFLVNVAPIHTITTFAIFIFLATYRISRYPVGQRVCVTDEDVTESPSYEIRLVGALWFRGRFNMLPFDISDRIPPIIRDIRYVV